MCIQLSMCGGGLNPTLTYRTVLGKKRNTKNKKIKKIFAVKTKSPPAKSRWAEIHYFDVLKTKKDLQLFSRRSSSDIGVLSVIGGDLHIFHPRNGEQMGRIGECFGESPTRISPKITLLQAIANYLVNRFHCGD